MNVIQSRFVQYVVVAMAAVVMAGMVTYLLNRLGY
jgi:hypothetical protein